MIRSKPKTLKGTRANVGLEAAYRKRLIKWIELLHNSVLYWLSSAYNQNEPVMAQDGSNVVDVSFYSPIRVGIDSSYTTHPAGMAQDVNYETDISVGGNLSRGGDSILDYRPIVAMDAVPAKELQKVVKNLSRRWNKNFKEAAPELAKWFGTSVWKRSDRDLKRILKEGGFSVEFTLTKAQRDVLHATINQNVSLIKSIPAQYLQKVEGMVMRSVQVGGDLATLTKQIQKEFRLTKKRAKLIAHDQTNKAFASLTRTRHIELGVKHAIWVHSHAGKHPRPTHLKNDGKKYDVKKGWYDPDPKVRKHIMPGELVNCRCFSRAIIEGFS